MSTAIKRIELLKKQSRRRLSVIEKESADLFNKLDRDYVSRSGITRSDLFDKIDKMKQCANVIELRSTQTADNTGFETSMRVAAANFCKQHILCPICSDRLQTRRRARFNDPVKQQARLVSEGKRYAYMITYTVLDGSDLSDQITRLKNAKRAFRRMGQKRCSDYSNGEASAIRAGVSTIEIKRGKNSGLWHSHSHDLIFTDRPLDYRVYDPEKRRKLKNRYGQHIPEHELLSAAMNVVDFCGKRIPVSKVSAEWLRATGGESINISVEKIRHIPKNSIGKKRRQYKKMSFEDSVAFQAREVLKYPVTTVDCKDEDFIVLITDTYNKRLVETIGEFRGLPKDDYNEDVADSDVENYVMVYKNGRYSGAIPGAFREQQSEEETNARSLSGRLLGAYRRHRRYLVDNREKIEGGISRLLDDAKDIFRAQYNEIWKSYRTKRDTEDRKAAANPISGFASLAALAGYYDPDISKQTAYSIVFS